MMALRRNGHYNKHLQNSWNKYGECSFETGIIIECDESDLDDLERYYIREYQSDNVMYGYNEESGGCVLKHHSERSKEKISARMSGENNPMYGVHLECSDETREKLSDANRGENNGFYGKHHTEEAKRKMSEAKRGKKPTHDDIINRGQNKRVRCVNNGMEFDALSFAAQWAGNTAPESISRVCYHKQKTAGHNPETNEKYIWEFI